MTQEEKRLLLIDLCTRLPYGIKGLHRGRVHIITDMDGRSSYPSIKVDDYDAWFPIETFKPYLRPMSSMTEEEKTKYFEMHVVGTDAWWIVNWLNERHLDYHYLIDKGLALEAPEGMYE